jgi:polyhydroxyalkanoate synthesis repressor PhaR
MRVIKKYQNRRLYDTDKSSYITLDELADIVRHGADVRVLDASTGDDLTQVTLTQIILERGGASRLLPVELLQQLIRMDDEALAEFLGKYLSWSLEMYLAAKRGAQAVSPYFPFATLPFNATNAMARMFTGHLPWAESAAPPRTESSGQIDELRREIEELKRTVGKKPG